MSNITLNEVERLADQLTPLDQVRLIEYLSRQIAPALAPQPALPANDAWERLERLREELARLPAERLASEQLEADRAERQRLLEGRGRADP